ncbi:MAG: hypothetical protein D6B25_07715 [Desulfobulbaceae bacterium]|nr:MAG: hypothetical protein D6B25_07715 [Desulfobulbaceae bacterium]
MRQSSIPLQKKSSLLCLPSSRFYQRTRCCVTQSLKAASIALGLIILLTLLKFFLYWLSGSVAVFSEAWHSFSDICTTLLVLISIFRQQKKQAQKHAVPAVSDEEEARSRRPNFIIRTYTWMRTINSELKIALLIGTVLLFASLAIIWKTWSTEAVEINAPLITGLIFIGLSFGSFFISRFESRIGADEQSAALLADSQHNRADMVISLLTGVSLIVYYFGINVDRYVGTFIALYIFSFATELIVNSIRAIALNQGTVENGYRFSSIMFKAFQLSTYKKLYNHLEHRLNLGDKFRFTVKTVVKSAGIFVKWGTRATLAGGLLLYFSTVFYTIKADERGLLFRFGRLVNLESDLPPGLHLKLPYPVDRVMKIKTGTIHTISLGNSRAEDVPMIWSKDHGDNQSFISADNNLFLPYIVIHYRITDIRKYFSSYKSGTSEKVISSVSSRLLNQYFTSYTFYDLILFKRATWTSEIKTAIQEQLDRLELGVELLEFCLKDLHPPIELTGEYEEVGRRPN